MRALFLGVGNLHRADDGVGPLLAQRLAEDPSFAVQGIEILPHSGEGASLMHLWEGQDHVVIVDAMKSSHRRGTVRRFDPINEVLHYGVFRYSSHLFGLAEAVEMSRALGTLPKAMTIFGIEGREFAFNAPMSPSVVKALNKVEKDVRTLLTELARHA